jgi:hypothetical protein
MSVYEALSLMLTLGLVIIAILAIDRNAKK